MMIFCGIESPLRNFSTVWKASGPNLGLDSTTPFSCPWASACTAPSVPSMETILMSLPGSLPAHVLDVGVLLADLGRGVRDDELLNADLLGLVPNGLRLRDPERVGLLLGLGEPYRSLPEPVDVRRLHVADGPLPAARFLDFLLGLLAAPAPTGTTAGVGPRGRARGNRQ